MSFSFVRPHKVIRSEVNSRAARMPPSLFDNSLTHCFYRTEIFLSAQLIGNALFPRYAVPRFDLHEAQNEKVAKESQTARTCRTVRRQHPNNRRVVKNRSATTTALHARIADTAVV